MTKSKDKRKAGILAAVFAAVTLVVALVVALVVSGGEKVVVYEANQDGATIRLTYYAKGDKVYKQTAENSMTYEALGVDSKEEAKEFFDGIMEDTSDIKGYSDVITYEDDRVIEIVTIDYNVVNIDEVKNVAGAYFEGNTSDGISLERSIKFLEEAGFKKVK